MTNEKIYFLRDSSVESQEAKAALDAHHVRYEEVFTQSDKELPCILASDSAIPFCGASGINTYISFFAPESVEVNSRY